MKEFDLITIDGKQFLVTVENTYHTTTDIPAVRDEYEDLVLQSLRNTQVTVSNYEQVVQGLICECLAIHVADRKKVIEIQCL